MTYLIHVGGIMGVGKSTLLQSLSKQSNEKDMIIEFGSIMREEALKEGIILSEKDFYDLPQQEIERLRNIAVDNVNYLVNSGVFSYLIFSSHYTLPVGDQIIPTFKSNKFSYEKLILIECSIDNLAQRLNSDGRERVIIEREKLEMYLKKEKEEAINVADELDLQLVIIPNDDFTFALEKLKYEVYHM